MVRTSARTPSTKRKRGATRPLIACVFGTRPQLIKVASVWQLLSQQSRLLLIDSGQHYDHAMAGTFYAGKRIRTPDINLGIKAKSAGSQVARIAAALDPVFTRRRPDAIVTFGDTSTTVGAAIAAAYQNIPVAHVEAGLRSFDLRAAEEKNRVLTDHLSRWLFCPTQTAIANLKNEGITRGVFGVGDVLCETFREVQSRATPNDLFTSFGLTDGDYYLVTCHRAETTDNPERLRELVTVLEDLDRPTLFAVHPRARKNLIRQRLWQRLKRVKTLHLVAPFDHESTIAAIAGAKAVLTDSGGVQREAYWSRVPCLVLRDRTEWVELTNCGAVRVVGLNLTRVRNALRTRWSIRTTRDTHFRKHNASQKIVQILLRELTSR
ncbi:MAG: UDP-N-acetylglucosamine 2-epimerase (non-hydrolyzing) [candidate division Zixibacteria bacterium]|nr:UDP-N-acetylglucosamine 2-epimerase (non-hydrolyzing) [candidate division Zixibacteria bacterium]